jgi:hypothetical protein
VLGRRPRHDSRGGFGGGARNIGHLDGRVELATFAAAQSGRDDLRDWVNSVLDGVDDGPEPRSALWSQQHRAIDTRLLRKSAFRLLHSDNHESRERLIAYFFGAKDIARALARKLQSYVGEGTCDAAERARRMDIVDDLADGCFRPRWLPVGRASPLSSAQEAMVLNVLVFGYVLHIVTGDDHDQEPAREHTLDSQKDQAEQAGHVIMAIKQRSGRITLTPAARAEVQRGRLGMLDFARDNRDNRDGPATPHNGAAKDGDGSGRGSGGGRGRGDGGRGNGGRGGGGRGRGNAPHDDGGKDDSGDKKPRQRDRGGAQVNRGKSAE